MGKNFSREDIERLIKNVSKQTNFSENDLKKAQSGNLEGLLSKLSPDQASKLNEVMSNEESAKNFFNTPQAQSLLKKFLEGK